MKPKFIQQIKIIILGIIFVAGFSFAWTGPTVNQIQAPSNNVFGPIDFSVIEQAKAGGLYIGYSTPPSSPTTVDVGGATYTQELEAKVSGTSGGNITVREKMRISASSGGTFCPPYSNCTPNPSPELNVAIGNIKSIPLAPPVHADPLPLCATSAGKIILCSLTAACGTADGQVLASKPTGSVLCFAGTAYPVPVSGGTLGPWNWTCTDSGSGATVNCSATKTPPPTVTLVGTGAGEGFIETTSTGFVGAPLSSPDCPSGASTCGTYCVSTTFATTSTICPTSGSFNPRTNVILTADHLPASSESAFTGWSGGGCVSPVSGNPKKCKITGINSDLTVTANFEPAYYIGLAKLANPSGANVGNVSVVSTSVSPSSGGSSISCAGSTLGYC